MLNNIPMIAENKISLCDKDEEKKLNYPDRISLILFDITQLDPKNNDLALIPNITYASILQNIKFKFLQKISILKAGKITLGINLTSNTQNSATSINEAEIDRIVFFYKNGTFKTYSSQ